MSNLERSNVLIREVWKDNLDYEFDLIRAVVDKYRYVAMDTEFPGVVLRPVGNFRTPNDFHYQTLRANVDLLKLIQLGLTFADEKGNLPTCGTEKYCVWQFNFCEFDPNEDVYANESVELLSQCGIDFRKNNEKGVSAVRFGELLMSSGVVLNDEVQWITFHSAYDFGYLVKLLSGKNLPDTEAEFLDVIKIFFPKLYDIKYMMKFCGNIHGGLSKVGELLGVKRIGVSHQAGSDSLLTCCTFMKLIEVYFDGSPENHAGVLFGLGVDGVRIAH